MVLLLEVTGKEEGVVALHLPIWSLKTSSGLKPVPRFEPIPTSLLADDIPTALSEAVLKNVLFC